MKALIGCWEHAGAKTRLEPFPVNLNLGRASADVRSSSGGQALTVKATMIPAITAATIPPTMVIVQG